MKDLTTSSIRNIPMFSELTDKEVGLIVARARHIRYPKGNIVFHEGDHGDYGLVILSGRVKVVLLGEDGQEVILALLGQDCFLGEMSLLDSAPRSATVITQEETEFLKLAQKDFNTLLESHPSLALNTLKYLSARLRRSNEQIRSLVMFDVYGRMARCFHNLAKHQGTVQKDHLVVRNKPSMQDLAHMIGCTRETLSRAMKVLQQGGYVTLTRKEIVIHRPW